MRPVGELGYSEASRELDEIVAFFEQREVDVDLLVARLERATAIVDELDRRLRRTRTQVEELAPRLARVETPEETDVRPGPARGGYEEIEEHPDEDEARAATTRSAWTTAQRTRPTNRSFEPAGGSVPTESADRLARRDPPCPPIVRSH